MNKIRVFALEDKFQIYEKKLKAIAAVILRILKKDRSEVDIYLIGGKKMRLLNKRFRGKDKDANILSFVEDKSFPHPETKLKHLGEIYLNPEYIIKQEKKSSLLTDYHLPIVRLLIHGLLHLFGYNHKRKNDRILMEKKEEEIIKNF